MTPDFAALREDFPTTRHWAHFDIARKAPLPRCVEAAMREYIRDVYERAGEAAFSMEQVELARATVAAMLGVAPRTLAFIKNTSEGLSIVARGLGLRPGEKVLLSEFEHENNVYPWRRLEAQGVEVVVVPARDGRIPVEAFVERMDSRTRVATVSWVSYGNGYRADVPALARACRERDILLVVDGIQGVGVLATPLVDLGADVVVAGGHKALLGLVGAGFLYCRADLIPKIDPPYAAKFSFATNDKWEKPLVLASDAHRFEYGNPNFLGIWVLRRSAEFITGIGLKHIEDRVRVLTTYLFRKAEERGLEILTPRAWEERAGIVSFDVPDPQRMQRSLHERRFIVNVKDGRILRTASHFYNTEEEIDRLVDAIDTLRREEG